MTEPQPPKLDYGPEADRYRRSRYVEPSAKFSAGLALGIGLSFVVWVLGWNPLPRRGSDSVAYTVLGVKFATGILFLLLPRWRLFGLGVLMSIVVGAMIFIATCGGNVTGGH